MSQVDGYTIAGPPLTMAALAARLEALFAAAVSANRGATAPGSSFEGMTWWDTSGAPVEVLKRYTVAAGWVSLLSVNVATGAFTIIGVAMLAAANEFNASQHLDGDALLWRFRDTGASGKEWGIRSDGGNLEVVENTGTEGAPTWTVRKTFIAGNPEPSASVDLVNNLKPVVNAAVNKLDIFTKTGGAVPNSTNFPTISIPDGNGYTARTRKATYLSGTSQFTLADATAYWGAVSGADNIKLHIYAIWDGTGVVLALSRFAGYLMVPTTVSAGDDDFFLLENSSTYTRSNAHYCVSIGHVWTNYNTPNNPDWTILATPAELTPQVIWNPKSDYGYNKNLATTISASPVPEQSVVNVVVKQSGTYNITFHAMGDNAGWGWVNAYIKTGSSTYGSAVYKATGGTAANSGNGYGSVSITKLVYLNAGDTIHGGAKAGGDAAHICGDSTLAGATVLTFQRAD